MVLDRCLLGRMELAESLDIYRDEKPERKALEVLRKFHSPGRDAQPHSCHDVTHPS
jgi:hypothetical protein